MHFPRMSVARCVRVYMCHYPFRFVRKEHKSHSPSCQFMALKKKVEELTVEEFFKLQKERHKIIIVGSFETQLTS